MATGLIIAGIVGSAGASIFSRHEAANAQQRQLQLQLQQEQVSANEKKIDLAQNMQKIMGAQVAAQGASGFSLASPSFGAIQTSTFDNFAKDEQAENLNELFKTTAIKEKQSEIGRQEIIGDVGTVFSALASFGEGGIFGAAKGAEAAKAAEAAKGGLKSGIGLSFDPF